MALRCTPRRADRRHAPAFTLIEVMVVVIVVVVLAGLAAPMLGQRRAAAELAAAARRVAQAAQLGRQEAARTRAEVRLVVGREAENAWTLETDGDEGPDGPPVPVRRGGLGGGTLPAGLAFAGVEAAPGAGADEDPAGDTVRFLAGGGATAAAVRLTGPAGTRAVRIHPSGRVEVAAEAAGPPGGRVDLDLD